MDIQNIRELIRGPGCNTVLEGSNRALSSWRGGKSITAVIEALMAVRSQSEDVLPGIEVEGERQKIA